MSNEKKKKLASTNSLLPSINYKQSISLVLLLLVTFTSPSTQAPSSSYDCPNGCVCDETQLKAKCENIDALIESYRLKAHHHVAKKNFMPIKSLDLSNNQLTKISNQLELMVNLTELNLSHNQLTQVHKLNFEHLESLDLSYNRITSAKLAKLPKNVANLNLSHNEITYLPSDFMKLKKLRSLELTENPLNCSCDTLMIRNWITYKHVWSDKIIKCASPQIFKGQPWLQARQNDICIESLSTSTQQSRFNWEDIDDDNDVMIGDDPRNKRQVAGDDDVEYEDGGDEVEGDGGDGTGDELPQGSNETHTDKDEKEDEKPVEDTDYDTEDNDIFDSSPSVATEETKKEVTEKNAPAIEEDFIPVTTAAPIVQSSSETSETAIKDHENSDEGSGSETSSSPQSITEEEEEESSGSGAGGILDNLPNSSLGIFEDQSTTESPETPLAIGTQKSAIKDEMKSSEAPPPTKSAQVEDNTGTYILLLIIGVLLISLIIFVAMKNRQEKRNNKRRYDVEKNGATELQDMDKRLLGKPIEKNGNGKHEHSPLISDSNYPKDDGFVPYTPAPVITVDEPIQEVPQKEKEKSQQSLYENNLPNGNGNVFEPIEPVHTTNGSVPKSPESDGEVFYPARDNVNGPDSLDAPVETPKRYSPIYTPISPRSARYSPVYSPDGRVKIKLTETPKPKTPIVVTRSRSRAGDSYEITQNTE